MFLQYLIFYKGNFDTWHLEIWNKPSALPYGIAAVISFAGGMVIVVMSMSQLYYVGPTALAAGGAPYGVDIVGCELGYSLTIVVFPILRYLELRVTKK